MESRGRDPPAQCAPTALCLSQPLPAAFSPGSSSQAGCSRMNRVLRSAEAGPLLFSPLGLTGPDLCFLSTAEAQVDTMVFLIWRDPDFGIPCLRLSMQPYSDGFPGTMPAGLLYVSFDEQLRGFFPLISVIKAPSCHSCRNDTSNSNLVTFPNSRPATSFCSPCLSPFAYVMLHLGGGAWEGNSRPFGGMAKSREVPDTLEIPAQPQERT